MTKSQVTLGLLGSISAALILASTTAIADPRAIIELFPWSLAGWATRGAKSPYSDKGRGIARATIAPPPSPPSAADWNTG